MARYLAFAALALIVLQAGCNQQQAQTPAGNEMQGTDESSLLQVAKKPQTTAGPLVESGQSPQGIVTAFLKAVREGDTSTTAALLTDKAREETAKHDLVVEPPGTPSAKFVVGEVQYIDDDQTGAHVNTVWTEADETGAAVTYDVVWALRRQPQGWRVAGIATEIVDGQNPVFLNFENPSDMLEKWRRAEEIAARHQQQLRHANAGATRR